MNEMIMTKEMIQFLENNKTELDKILYENFKPIFESYDFNLIKVLEDEDIGSGFTEEFTDWFYNEKDNHKQVTGDNCEDLYLHFSGLANIFNTAIYTSNNVYILPTSYGWIQQKYMTDLILEALEDDLIDKEEIIDLIENIMLSFENKQ